MCPKELVSHHMGLYCVLCHQAGSSVPCVSCPLVVRLKRFNPIRVVIVVVVIVLQEYIMAGFVPFHQKAITPSGLSFL